MLYYFNRMEILRRGVKQDAISIGNKYPNGDLHIPYVMRTHYGKHHIWDNMGSFLCMCCNKVEWKMNFKIWG